MKIKCKACHQTFHINSIADVSCAKPTCPHMPHGLRSCQLLTFKTYPHGKSDVIEEWQTPDVPLPVQSDIIDLTTKDWSGGY